MQVRLENGVFLAIQLFESGAKTRQRHRDANTGFLGLEYDEYSGLAIGHALDKFVIDGNLGIAGERMAAQKWRIADILIVDFEAYPAGKKDAKRGEYPENLGTVREGLVVDRQSNVFTILRRYRLNKGAHLVFGARGRGFADHLPITVLGFNRPILRLLRLGEALGAGDRRYDHRKDHHKAQH